MKRILLIIEYDGTAYSGWQRQPNKRTIQGEIEEAIFRSIGEKLKFLGAVEQMLVFTHSISLHILI